jgi:hypothetical protein
MRGARGVMNITKSTSDDPTTHITPFIPLILRGIEEESLHDKKVCQVEDSYFLRAGTKHL